MQPSSSAADGTDVASSIPELFPSLYFGTDVSHTIDPSKTTDRFAFFLAIIAVL